MKEVWAFDLGASNGRLMLGGFDGRRLTIKEIHRFSNQPVNSTGRFYWDILRIFQEMKIGISKSINMGHKKIEGMSIDTWGVDFGLLASNGELLGNPYSYRDSQGIDGASSVQKMISNRELFNRTGNEPLHINTIFQLAGLNNRLPNILKQADTLLLMPNLISYLFSGEKGNDYTNCTTTQLFCYNRNNWDDELIHSLQLSRSMFAPVIAPLTIAGTTMGSINKELEINRIPMISGSGHDTACAVAALPLKNKRSVFISCGTWVLIGVKVDEPNISDKAMAWGFTNEGHVDGTYRLQKNNMGLWLIQQCRAAWEKEGLTISYEEENEMLKHARPFRSLINPDDQLFFNPENMLEAIRAFCRKTNQLEPETKGEFIRCILESLALKYRWVVDRLSDLTNDSLDVIYMGGGGIQNEWLCQFTANATRRTVVAGPVEASAVGNALCQWITLGEIKDFTEGQQIVKDSFPSKEYDPMEESSWKEAYERFIQYLPGTVKQA